MKDASEGEDLDIDDMLSRGCLVVEWPENIRSALPVDSLSIAMRWMAEEQRGMVISTSGKMYGTLLTEIRQQLYGDY